MSALRPVRGRGLAGRGPRRGRLSRRLPTTPRRVRPAGDGSRRRVVRRPLDGRSPHLDLSTPGLRGYRPLHGTPQRGRRGRRPVGRPRRRHPLPLRRGPRMGARPQRDGLRPVPEPVAAGPLPARQLGRRPAGVRPPRRGGAGGLPALPSRTRRTAGRARLDADEPTALSVSGAVGTRTGTAGAAAWTPPIRPRRGPPPGGHAPAGGAPPVVRGGSLSSRMSGSRKRARGEAGG